MYLDPEPNNEMLECFNEQKNIIESHTREEVHIKPLKYWHGVTNVYIVNKNLQLLCSKRSESLIGNPGKWQTYFGGHVKAGQTFKQTAVTELEEEIGIQIDEKNLYHITSGQHTESKHFFESYAYLFENSEKFLNFNDGEITEVKWITMPEYLAEKKSHSNNWCNSCSPETWEKICKILKQTN
jgi:isopentenyldiphosphate isomerase